MRKSLKFNSFVFFDGMMVEKWIDFAKLTFSGPMIKTMIFIVINFRNIKDI